MATININNTLDVLECPPKICNLSLKVESYGSDADDKLFQLAGVQVNATTSVSLGHPVDVLNAPEMVSELNKLNLGTWYAFPTDGGLTEIGSVDNPQELLGLKFIIENPLNAPVFFEFASCDCIELPPCDGEQYCDYGLYREYKAIDGNPNDQFYFNGIKWTLNGTPYVPTSPLLIDDTIGIAAFINSLSESENKAQVYYDQTTYKVTIQIVGTKYVPEYVNWQGISGTPAGGSQTNNYQTTFGAALACRQRCCLPCGTEGAFPCPNGATNGCNTGLEPVAGVCRKICTPWTAYVMGQTVAAGLLGQPCAACGTPCRPGLICSAAGCQPIDMTMRKCDWAFTVATNPNEQFISIRLCDLGEFKLILPQKFLMGDGSELIDWLNNDSGACTTDTKDCFSITVAVDPETDLTVYTISLENANLQCAGMTKNPITTTTEFNTCKGQAYDGCVVPSNCELGTFKTTCTATQTFDSRLLKCVPNTISCANKTIGGFSIVPCPNAPAPNFTADEETLIISMTTSIRSNFDKIVAWEAYYKSLGIPMSEVTWRAAAIAELVRINQLPYYKRPCYSHNGSTATPIV